MAETEKAALLAENHRLRAALLQHRADLHQWSQRPCPTCRHSADVLGLKVPDGCARKEWDEAAIARPEAISAFEVLAWLRARPGASWVATIEDLEKAMQEIVVMDPAIRRQLSTV